MFRAYRFRMYPTANQRELIQKTFGCTRVVYNHYLEKQKSLYKDGKDALSCFDMIRDLKNLQVARPYLKEVDSCSLRCSLFNLDDAFKRWYKGQGEYPKFKGKYNSKRSYRTNCISNTYNGKTYQSIEVLVEENNTPCKVQPKKIVGIDLGIKDIVITSDNEKIGNPSFIKKYEKRIARCQRELSRRVRGSNNYYKTKKRLAVLYQKLKNARKYFIHQITKKLVIENDIIVTEDLNVKGMIEEKKLSKHLTNVSLGEICRVLEYKARCYGKKYIKIDSFYPSSQKCSQCGYKNEKVKELSVRSWVCPECGSYHDRDYNASYNILFEGLKIYIKRYM